VFQTLTTTYASEVMPVPLRCYLCTYVNLCWVMGQFIASGVLRAMLNNNTQWSYRIPFALQWMWPVPIIVGCIFAPESPWWLVRVNRLDDAKKSLLRLTSSGNADFNVDDTVAMMVHTNEVEKDISAGTSYWDCFKGVDRRRTEIVVGVWAIQNLCGSSFMGYSTYFYQQAGLSKANSFDFSMGQYALGAVGTVASWFLMAGLGRRTIYLWGLVALDILVLLIGFLGIGPDSNASLSYAIGSMLLIYTFTCESFPQPARARPVGADAPQTTSPSVRSATPSSPSSRPPVSATRPSSSRATSTTSWASSTTSGRLMWVLPPVPVAGLPLTTSQMLNPTAWNWGAKTGFFWGGWCFLCLVWTYFRLPEPKGRTYGELDILFENRVSARKFRTTTATQFQGESTRLGSVSGPTDTNFTEHKDMSA
jgi:SP family general alpha glucoside:H+ symporter-like MFS transporter